MKWTDDKRPFSRRLGYAPGFGATPLVEDAPTWLRTVFDNQILGPLMYIDGDSRYANTENRPLGIKKLYEELCYVLRQEPDSGYTDSWGCSDVLGDLVRTCEWYQFYDIVEFVARRLKDVEEARNHEPAWVSRFGFTQYQVAVNSLFRHENVAWVLSDSAELALKSPKALADRMNEAESQLEGKYGAARVHYKKAVRYATHHPVDPENSIKEMVAAIESIGRTNYPSSSTLGDVVKRMRRRGTVPVGLVNLIEKFYAFASAEPAVRHGAPVPSTVSQRDAEFCIHVGIALVRYMLADETSAT